MFGSAPLKRRVMCQFAEISATDGVQLYGLIGPREAPRLWDRHLLNCAVVADLLPEAGELVDIGSGARSCPAWCSPCSAPELIRVVLLEPMLRRSAFLEECLARLDLPNAVVRGRAEEHGGGHWGPDIATARAVAPLDRLAGWAAELLRGPGVRSWLIQGQSAAARSQRLPAVLSPTSRAKRGGSAGRPR